MLDRLATHRDVAYHPETAYWIAFDNSVPTYLPLYTRSRHYDLAQIRARTRAVGGDELGRHIVFSSGWEWGYWQNDWAVLQMSYELGASPQALQERMLAPLPGGAELANIVNELAELQQTSLLEGRLAAYLASTDFTFALGVAMGFWSQPRRPEFDALLGYDATQAAEFRARVLVPLESLRDDTAALFERFSGGGIDEYGYLREADTLCYYRRELAQLEVALGGTSTVPGCNL